MRRKCRLVSNVLLAILPCLAVRAQAPAAGSREINTTDSSATFRSGVNLVLVPVVVRDRQGRAVGNLRREDFALQDKGAPQIISQFTLESRGSAAPATASEADGNPPARQNAPAESTTPARFVAYLFDDVHFANADLQAVRNAAQRHLSETLDATTRAAIYTTSGRVALPFTDDREQLRQTLEKISPYASLAYSPTDCPHIDYYMADLIVNKNDQQALNVATNDVLGCLSPRTDIPDVVKNSAVDMARSAALRGLRAGDAETRMALEALRNLVLRMSSTPGSRSIVLISSGFLLTSDRGFDQADIINRAIRGRVTINTLDARGLFGVMGVDVSQPTMNGGQHEFRMKYESALAFAGTETLSEFADGTGGRFFHNSDDLAQGLDQLAAQPEFFYVLGFAPRTLKFDGSYHALKVSLRNPGGFTVQARRGYYAPTRADAAPDQASDRAKEEIVEAVFSQEELRAIPIALNLRYFKNGDFKAVLSVVTRIDPKTLRFRKEEGRSHDDLTIVAGLFDGNGNFLNGSQKTVEMHLRDQTLEELTASGITVRNTFDLTPGPYLVRVVARDSEGRTMGAVNRSIQIP
jgi:VWFA-related protein